MQQSEGSFNCSDTLAPARPSLYKEEGDASSTVIACHQCGHLHQSIFLEKRARIGCSYCGATLYHYVPNGAYKALALYLSGLMLWIIANSFPFLSLQVGESIEQSYLVSGVVRLYQQGMAEMALVVLLTSILFPLLLIGTRLWLLMRHLWDSAYAPNGRLIHFVHHLSPWSMVGVMLFAVLLSIIKLQGMATVIPGISLYALFVLMVVLVAAERSFDLAQLWSRQGAMNIKQISRCINSGSPPPSRPSPMTGEREHVIRRMISPFPHDGESPGWGQDPRRGGNAWA